jgi:aryl-alcohol dehydrogenase
MQVNAAVLRERNTPLVLEDISVEDPRADEVLVRIVATGICHSDVSVINGDLPLPTPIILGHEGSGIIESVGCRPRTAFGRPGAALAVFRG